VKIELGCGPQHDSAYFGIDCRPFPGVDLVWDLECCPLPLPDGCCEEIGSSHVLEHIQHLIPLLNDCHRLLKPGGIFWACVPQACDSRGQWYASAFQDPTHVRFFVPATWLYFVGDHALYRFGRLYDISPWELIRLQDDGPTITVILRKPERP
jgi:SAM-dependent methyltransferase